MAALVLAYLRSESLGFDLEVSLAVLGLSSIILAGGGLAIFSFGVWPVVRQIVRENESSRRQGRQGVSSPKIGVANAPILFGLLLFAINWIL